MRERGLRRVGPALSALLLLAGCSGDGGYEVSFESDADLSRYDAVLVYPLFYAVGDDGEAVLLPSNPHALFADELSADAAGEGGMRRDVYGLEKRLLDALSHTENLAVFDARSAETALSREGDGLMHCILQHQHRDARVGVTLRMEDQIGRPLAVVRCSGRLADPQDWRDALDVATGKAARAFLDER